MVPMAVSVEIVSVLPDFLGKFVVVGFRGGHEAPLTVFGPAVEVVVAQVLLGRSRCDALGGDGPLTGPHQHRARLGGHGRNARIDDELHRTAVFQEVGPVLTLALRGEGAAGGFHDHVGIAGEPQDEASGPEAEPVRTVSFHVVQLGPLVHPRRDPAREAQFDLAGFPRPDAVAGQEGAAPLRLVRAEVVGPLVPDVAVDDAEVPVGVRPPGFLVGLRERCRGVPQDQQQAQDA
ncbi:MAG: hypothetical protein F4Y71_04740 [Acidobacteria bacterium]|nr:hypothetical protein [Acidobacteriota bacterium]MYG76248.1 hypothetical protein [Acidobacteriota bacterium]